MSHTDTSEKGLETLIVESLTGEAGTCRATIMTTAALQVFRKCKTCSSVASFFDS